MGNINYQNKLDQIVKNLLIENKKPSLLLHSCCAPCSSYVLNYLSNYFKITIFFYNPNIHPFEEYIKRLNDQKKLISNMQTPNKIDFIEGVYNQNDFYKNYQGLENEPEGGRRCFICCYMRLLKCSQVAAENQFDYFSTTLTVSPHKNAKMLNEIGQQLEQLYNIKFLYSDFKKKEGYKKSIELSKIYNLYRQNYCGCIFSKNQNNDLQ